MKRATLGTDQHVQTIRWLPPVKKDMVKLNFDGLVSKDRVTATYVIRDYDGQVVGAGAFNLDGVTILFAEVMGLKE